MIDNNVDIPGLRKYKKRDFYYYMKRLPQFARTLLLLDFSINIFHTRYYSRAMPFQEILKCQRFRRVSLSNMRVASLRVANPRVASLRVCESASCESASCESASCESASCESASCETASCESASCESASCETASLRWGSWVGIYCLENAHLSVILCAFDELILYFIL